MTLDELKRADLPDKPGVYRFLDQKGKILYIGKATSLRDRVRSYFSNDLMHTRGKHIVDMVTLASTVRVTTTASVLEALILEASLIKRNQPQFNTKEKDDKSWNYVVMTNEDFPRVMRIRERTMLISGSSAAAEEYRHIFGPFPKGSDLDEALNIIRKILPFRDTCNPMQGKPCFNRQIGLCPGVCTGECDKRAYQERIQEIKLFFEGKKDLLIKRLEKLMAAHAKVLEFEEAGDIKRMIFALKHIKDASLIKEEIREHSQRTAGKRRKPFRIEAYDIAHISGKYTVGVMTVVLDGKPSTAAYRKFKIRIDPEHSNDTLHLEEILTRRFAHGEWTSPDIIVVDGGVAQRRIALKVATAAKFGGAVVSVVKDDRHKAKALLGPREITLSYKNPILIANMESHRFAVNYHRQLRDKIPRVVKKTVRGVE